MDGNKLFIASQSCTHSMQWASRELATPPSTINIHLLLTIGFMAALYDALSGCRNLSLDVM